VSHTSTHQFCCFTIAKSSSCGTAASVQPLPSINLSVIISRQTLTPFAL